MSAGLSIRPAAERDYDGIHHIVMQDDVFPHSFCHRRIPSDPDFLNLLWYQATALYVASDGPDGEPLGFARIAAWYAYERVGLLFVAVDGDHRRQGVGDRLIGAMETVASDLLELRMLIGHVPEAHGALAGRDGWKECGRLRHHVYVRGEPTDLLVCSLHR